MLNFIAKRKITKQLTAFALAITIVMQLSASAFAVSTTEPPDPPITPPETNSTPETSNSPSPESGIPPETSVPPAVEGPNTPSVPLGLTSIDPNYVPPLEQYLAPGLDSNDVITSTIGSNGIPPEEMAAWLAAIEENGGEVIPYEVWEQYKPQPMGNVDPSDQNPIRAFSADTHVLLAPKSGGLIVWGDNGQGQLGDPSLGSFVSKPTPIEIFKDKVIISVIALETFSIVITSDFTMYFSGSILSIGKEYIPLNTGSWTNFPSLSAKRPILLAKGTDPLSCIIEFADGTSSSAGKAGTIGTTILSTFPGSQLIGDEGIAVLTEVKNYVGYYEDDAGDALYGAARDNWYGGSQQWKYAAGIYSGRHATGLRAYAFRFLDPNNGITKFNGSWQIPSNSVLDSGASIQTPSFYLPGGNSAYYTKKGRVMHGSKVPDSSGFHLLYMETPQSGVEPRSNLFYNAIGFNEFYSADTGFRILANDTVQVAGSNINGKAGVGSTANTVGEQVIHALTGKGIQYVEGTGNTTFFISSKGRVYATGSNANGELGQGLDYFQIQSTTPLEVNWGLITANTITVNNTTGGTILTSKTSATKDDVITVTASPSAGYELVPGSLTYNGIQISGNSFIMPDGPVTVTATFRRQAYTVSVFATSNGAVSVSKTSAAPGETIYVTVRPSAGFQMRPGSLKYNSIPMSGTSFTMPNGPTTVSAEFERVPYNVYITQPANGTIQASVYQAYPGDNVNLLITPNTGYALTPNSLKYNGTLVPGSSFVMPASNVTITASFQASSYSISVHPAANGSVSVDKPSATPGQTVTVTASPNNGFALKASGILVNNAPIAGNTFVMPYSGVSVTAQFEPVYYAVQTQTPTNGTLTVNKSLAIINEGITVSAVPSPGYKLKDGGIAVNGTAISGNSFSMPNTAVTVTAQFEPILYNIIVNDRTEGTISINKTQAYTGDTVAVSVKPADGYRVRNGTLRYDNIPITTGSFRMPSNDTSITCEFDVIYNNISIVPPDNGTLTSSKNTALLGDTIIVNAVPNRGYSVPVGAVRANGIAVDGNSFLMPLSDVTLTAQFNPIPYTIETQSSERGKIVSSATTGYVNDLIELSIMPNEGYRMKPGTLRVNGTVRDQDNFVMPAANVLVTIDFEPIQYPVNTEVATGGTTKVDRVTAKIGDLVKIQTVAENGYEFDPTTLRVNDTVINEKQFTMGAQDTTVKAEYKAIDYKINIPETANGKIKADKLKGNINDVININVEPADGYRLVSGSLRVNGTPINGTSFVMPATEVTISGSFEPIQYGITLPSIANGRVIASKNTAIVNDKIRLTVLPNTGYEMVPASLTYNNKPVTAGEFTMPADNVIVDVAFDAIVYDVKTAKANNGKIEVDRTTAKMNERVTIRTVPDAGYQLVSGSIKLNNISQYSNAFSMPAEDVLISAEFEPIVYTVRTIQSANGTVTVDKPNATIGQEVTVYPRPDKGYVVKDATLRVDGAVITNNKFVMPAKTVEITVEYERVLFDIDLKLPDFGTASIDRKQAYYNDDVTLTLKPDPGFSVGNSTVKVNGNAIQGNTFKMPEKNVTVTIDFSSVTYNLIPGTFSGGRVTFNKTYASVGEEVEIVIEPDSGFSFVDGSLTINGAAQSTLKFKMPARDVKCEAKFTSSLVTGVVSDETNKAVAGIDVVIESAFYSDRARSNERGEFSFKQVPNGKFTLKTNDYTWQNATTTVEVKEGRVLSDQRFVLTISRDRSVENVEKLIQALPQQTSSQSTIMGAEGQILFAKNQYDALDASQKAKVNETLATKLTVLCAKITKVQVEVLSSLRDVEVTDVELSINKEQYVTIDSDPRQAIKLQVFVNPLDEPAPEDEMLAQEKINEFESIHSYLDISVFQSIGVEDPISVEQLNKPITISIGLQDKTTDAKYKVVRLHGGQADLLSTTVTSDKITFKTDKFSTYAIVSTVTDNLVGGNKDSLSTLFWERVIRRVQKSGPWDIVNENISEMDTVPVAVVQTINDWTGEMHFEWNSEAFMLTGKFPIEVLDQRMFYTVQELIELSKKRPITPEVIPPVDGGIAVLPGTSQNINFDEFFNRLDTTVGSSINKSIPKGLMSFMTGKEQTSVLDVMSLVLMFTFLGIMICTGVVFLAPIAQRAGIRVAESLSRKIKRHKKRKGKVTRTFGGELKNATNGINKAAMSVRAIMAEKAMPALRNTFKGKRWTEKFKDSVGIPETTEVIETNDESDIDYVEPINVSPDAFVSEGSCMSFTDEVIRTNQTSSEPTPDIHETVEDEQDTVTE